MGWEAKVRPVLANVWRDDTGAYVLEEDVTIGDLRAALSDLDAARAEIERLRTAAADERADVVAYLDGCRAQVREHEVDEYDNGRAVAYRTAADDVSRGAHVGAAKGGERG